MTGDPDQAPSQAEPCGVAVVNKPTGVTSHDVVTALRRRLGTRRVGHTGTLDPLATGVLVLCVGAATRLAEFIPTEPKEYEAEVVLGKETDTQDSTGTVVAEHDASRIQPEDVGMALERFRGPILQVPPMYSALKSGGQRLYNLARRGQTVDRPPRPVCIHDIALLDFRSGSHPILKIRVVCSSGTYIRTLAHDLGRVLGVGGCMSRLTRTRVGPFTLSQASDISVPPKIIPVQEALSDWPLGFVPDDELEKLVNGQPVPLASVVWERSTEGHARGLIKSTTGDTLVVADLVEARAAPRKVLRCAPMVTSAAVPSRPTPSEGLRR